MRNFSFTKRLYIIQVLCLVLIGMCFHSVEADSSFLRTEENSLACQILDDDTNKNEQLVAYISMNREESLDTTKNASNGTIKPRTSANFCTTLLFYFQQFIFQAWTDIGKYLFLCVLFSHTLLLSYIHHKDGKKSFLISFIS